LTRNNTQRMVRKRAHHAAPALALAIALAVLVPANADREL